MGYRWARKRTDLAPLYRALEQRFAGRKEWVIYDIGANDAGSGIAYARAFPNCRVELFEAHPEVAQIARDRLAAARLGNRIQLHEFAASNADGVAQFHVSSQPAATGWRKRVSDSSSLLEPAKHIELHPHIAFAETIEVPTRRLDGWLEESNASLPHFLHMDVQGAELMVLEGLGSALAHVEAIWLEVERVELYKGQPLVDDVHRVLHENGFELAIDAVGANFDNQLWLRGASNALNADGIEQVVA